MDCQEYDLVTFGCSFTYGHGLHDCIAEDGLSNGPRPSVLAWPNQLKSLCNFKTVDNMAEPGASNKIITKHIVEYKKYSKQSFVVIYWANFDRHTIFFSKDNTKRIHMMPNFLSDTMPKDFWKWHTKNINRDEKEFQNLIKNYYGYFHHEFDVYFDNIIRLNYVNSWLRSKGIECRHLFGEHEWNNDTLKRNKSYFNKYMMPDVKIKTFNYRKEFHIDDALDKPQPHPGMASHKLFAHNIKKWFKL